MNRILYMALNNTEQTDRVRDATMPDLGIQNPGWVGCCECMGLSCYDCRSKLECWGVTGMFYPSGYGLVSLRLCFHHIKYSCNE